MPLSNCLNTAALSPSGMFAGGLGGVCASIVAFSIGIDRHFEKQRKNCREYTFEGAKWSALGRGKNSITNSVLWVTMSLSAVVASLLVAYDPSSVVKNTALILGFDAALAYGGCLYIEHR